MILAERAYQRAALNGGTVRGVAYPGIYAALREHRSTLLELATGLGKTIVFSRVVEAAVLRKGARALILAHREELIEQARSKLIAATQLDSWQIGIEMGKLQAHGGHQVVCASVQTMRGKRLASYRPNYFGLIVVDEAHHAVAPTYRDILAHFGAAKVLGVTATPKPLAGSRVFESVAYRFGLVDGIQGGYLVPIRGQLVSAPEINLADVKTVAGDFAHDQLAGVMEREKSVAVAAKATIDLAEGRPTIVFCVSVAQAHLIADAINAVRPGRAAALDGSASSDARKAVLRRYESGEVQYLINCALFTEGFDAPKTACVVVARPTKSHTLYAQMVGRGTRLVGHDMDASVANGKSDLLILDLAGATGRHELAQCVDLMTEDEEVRRRAKKRMAKQVPLDLVLAEVADELAQEAAERQRQEVEAARYKAKAVPILRNLPPSTMTAEQAPKFYHLDRLARLKYKGAAEQLDWHRRGVYRGPWTRESAAAMVSEIGKRERRGLCSPKQAELLRRQGFNGDVSKELAGEVTALVNNNWRPPAGLLVQYPELAPLQTGQEAG